MAAKGELVTESLAYDGGRQITVYVPPGPADAVVYAGDGQWHLERLVGTLEADGSGPSTIVVGVHGMPDDDGRLKEYVPGFDPEQFAAHESFFVEDVRRAVQELVGIALPAERTAVWGASLGGELALAMGVAHPDVFGVVLSASPGAGYRPPTDLPRTLPRVYLVAGSEEQFFLDNAVRWADALREGGADVVMEQRAGGHGDAFWGEEFPLMVRWAFGP